MASKRPNLTQRPSASQAADQWVQNGSAITTAGGAQPRTQELGGAIADNPTTDTAPAPAVTSVASPASSTREATRRLTLDLPESLHRAMKIKAATTGVTMLDEVRALLEVHYGTNG